MSGITIDYQDAQEECAHCGRDYAVSRGSVYDQGRGASIYLAALHECQGGRVVHLAIAVKEGYADFSDTCAAVLQVRNGGVNFEMSLTDPQFSPWRGLSYLGRILTANEVRDSAYKKTFFHIADHLVVENPTINGYLSEA